MKFYRVKIQVFEGTGIFSTVDTSVIVEAETEAQAIRKAGMTVVQELHRKEKKALEEENN